MPASSPSSCARAPDGGAPADAGKGAVRDPCRARDDAGKISNDAVIDWASCFCAGGCTIAAATGRRDIDGDGGGRSRRRRVASAIARYFEKQVLPPATRTTVAAAIIRFATVPKARAVGL